MVIEQNREQLTPQFLFIPCCVWCSSDFFFFLMIRRPPRSTHCISSAASDVYKRQAMNGLRWCEWHLQPVSCGHVSVHPRSGGQKHELTRQDHRYVHVAKECQ
eukprot:TRINITY_DN8697_c0_g1_i3.p2 TRINITY_DN8697_c0_g1~~TRINITY_DN8697_c0_g1_i3.p2  ORF type:complete len:103 (+),score=7.92 TRINITY_DN8697_c0_g1_i3:46-354(+)